MPPSHRGPRRQQLDASSLRHFSATLALAVGKAFAGQHLGSGGGTCAAACCDEDLLQMTSAVGSCGGWPFGVQCITGGQVGHMLGTLCWAPRRPCAAGHAAAPVPTRLGLAQTRNTTEDGPAANPSAVSRSESYLLLLAWRPLPTPNSSFHHRRPQPARHCPQQ